MSQNFSPKIVTNGLVLCYDAANGKSFRGVAGTNLLQGVNFSYSATDTTYFKTRVSTENVYIPALGNTTAKATFIYNDYSGGSGACCPNIFYFHNALITISPSTTYTYAIIYKTLTGYTHPNYMYRYEYKADGVTYNTEGGVHSTSNRISLGDGWWYAWGQFTTQATSERLVAYLFHYEYATNNTVYVAAASLTAGTYIYPPNQLIGNSVTRGSTVATGGGMIDMSGLGSAAEFVNTPTFDTSSLGSMSFGGTNQIVIAPENSALNTQTPTVETWIKTNALSQNGFFFEKGNVNTQYSLFQEGGNIVWRQNLGGSVLSMTALSSTYLSTSRWAHIVGTYTTGSRILYVNGVAVNSDAQTGTISTNTNGISIGAYGGYNGSRGYYYNGYIGSVRVYNRVLTPTEIKQNYNAGKGRYGI